jgi:hypothetical protein
MFGWGPPNDPPAPPPPAPHIMQSKATVTDSLVCCGVRAVLCPLQRQMMLIQCSCYYSRRESLICMLSCGSPTRPFPPTHIHPPTIITTTHIHTRCKFTGYSSCFWRTHSNVYIFYYIYLYLYLYFYFYFL